MSTDDHVGNGGIGLSDQQNAAESRRMLDIVNRLHSMGVQYDMDLPVIAVTGTQSAGKSSIIEGMSGVALPRAAGLCTRCPIECKLTHSTAPWNCAVSLRFTDSNGRVRNERFGDVLLDKSEVEDRIRRAQRAVLNPSTPCEQFLDGEELEVDYELTFSKNCVCLQINGSDVADLSFVDLPGLIATAGQKGNPSDVELVKDLVNEYISRPSCLILSTVACETDFAVQGAHQLAQAIDPEGKRTIGVLTKPDRIQPGDEELWLRYIRNEAEALQHGWYVVKQPNSTDLAKRISWEDARAAESNYFSETSSWSSLDERHQRQLGTSNLTERLSIILSDLIAKRLPEIDEEITKLLETTQKSLAGLPKPPSNDPFAEVLQLISGFMRDLSRHLEGIPGEKQLLQSIGPDQERFRKAIRLTAPEFRPYERRHATKRKLPALSFLDNEEQEPPKKTTATVAPSLEEIGPGDAIEEMVAEASPSKKKSKKGVSSSEVDKKAIYIDEVFRRAQNSRTRELPDNFPFVVQNSYITSFTDQWRQPALDLFDAVNSTLGVHLKRIIFEHFGSFGSGKLKQMVQLVAFDHLNKCGERTKEKIAWLIDLEKRAFTLNTHYFRDYRDKFLAFYRGCREREGEDGQIVYNLQSYQSHHGSFGYPTAFQESMTRVLSDLPQLGLPGTKPMDLTKLLPRDPMEPALIIMADVRAYFQVAYKRFADTVPMAIDHDFVLGVESDLEKALYSGLKISGPDGHKNCKEFVQESPAITKRREELQTRLDRLNAARLELLEVA